MRATDRFGAFVDTTINVSIFAAPVVDSVSVVPNNVANATMLTAMPTGTDHPGNLPFTFNYQWLQGGVPIFHATTPTLDLSAAPLGNVHVGDTFSVKITPTDASHVVGAVFTTTPVTITATGPFSIT